MTKIVGLTGGIGSGKSTIANYFMALGIPVYIADEESRKLTDSPEISAKIRKQFGSAIFDSDQLNRARLATLVFGNPEKLNQLNAIVHPAVKQHFDSWLRENANSPLIIKETAILFESGSYIDCDQIITVTAPIETRIERVIERDKTTREKVVERIDNQWSDEQRIAKSDFVIENENLQKAKAEAYEILKKLMIQ